MPVVSEIAPVQQSAMNSVVLVNQSINKASISGSKAHEKTHTQEERHTLAHTHTTEKVTKQLNFSSDDLVIYINSKKH